MDGRPDVEIAAAVRAEEVRFECVPDVRIGAWASVPASAERTSERENLPDRVAPGVTYRDIAVRWRLAARIDDQ